jgi:hypothetical protein
MATGFVNHRIRDAQNYNNHHLPLGESRQSGLERQTEAGCLVVGYLSG